MTYTLDDVGSALHMQGKGQVGFGQGRVVGVTPACTGKSWNSPKLVPSYGLPLRVQGKGLP